MLKQLCARPSFQNGVLINAKAASPRFTAQFRSYDGDVSQILV